MAKIEIEIRITGIERKRRDFKRSSRRKTVRMLRRDYGMCASGPAEFAEISGIFKKGEKTWQTLKTVF